MREREDANRTREAGNRDEVEGAVANTLKLYRNGAVGFIDWLDDLMSLDPVGFPIEFSLTDWTITNRRRRDKYFSSAAQ